MPIDRYSRQIATGLVSPIEQEFLATKTVAVVGLGAIGSVSAELILRSGIKSIMLIDRDFVEESNLQRQRYCEKDIGLPKAEALKARLLEIDSGAEIFAHAIDIDQKNIDVLSGADIILDGCDNLNTRFLINDFAVKNGIPWVYAAAIGTLGATMNIVPSGPCFSCVFGKNLNPAEIETCETRGIISSASTAIASIQCAEAIKILLEKKDISQSLLYLDAWSGDAKKILVEKNLSCDAHSAKFSYLNGMPAEAVAICGKNSYQIKPQKNSALDLEKFRKRFGNPKAKLLPGILHINLGQIEVSLFPDSRAIVRGAKTKGEAHAAYARVVGE